MRSTSPHPTGLNRGQRRNLAKKYRRQLVAYTRLECEGRRTPAYDEYLEALRQSIEADPDATSLLLDRRLRHDIVALTKPMSAREQAVARGQKAVAQARAMNEAQIRYMRAMAMAEVAAKDIYEGGA